MNFRVNLFFPVSGFPSDSFSCIDCKVYVTLSQLFFEHTQCIFCRKLNLLSRVYLIELEEMPHCHLSLDTQNNVYLASID